MSVNIFLFVRQMEKWTAPEDLERRFYIGNMIGAALWPLYLILTLDLESCEIEFLKSTLWKQCF